jgi:RNA ligase (TIGR02306 family)
MGGIAYVGQISEILDIENADFLQTAVVVCGAGGKWTGVVKKGDFSVGEEVEVYLQDAIVPYEERFSFMEKYHYRVRMARLRGARSECLIMKNTVDAQVGADISDMIGATKYEKPVPVSLLGEAYGVFPSFIPKTDEVHWQAFGDVSATLHGIAWYATEKADGTSCTAYYRDGRLSVCSRNWEKKDGDNVYWEMARKYDLADIMTDPFLEGTALQFEIVGPGIQKNPMGLKEREIRLFDAYDYYAHEYRGRFILERIHDIFLLPLAQLVQHGIGFDFSEEEILKMAEGEYPNGKQREGIVVRSQKEFDPRISFKVINLLYKG